MALSLPDRALLLKLFYQNGDNAAKALRLYRGQKSLRKGPVTPCALRRMVKRFEETGSFAVQAGRGRRKRIPQLMEDVATAVVEQANSNTTGVCSARAVSRQLGLSQTTVWRCMRIALNAYPYKIQRLQELKPGDNDLRETFALTFLARMEVEQNWPYNILWTDEAHFYMRGTVNTHNCRIWSTEIPHQVQQMPLNSPHVTAWIGFTATFMIGPYFCEEITPQGPKTCSVTAARYRKMLEDMVIPELQQRGCLATVTFQQDGAPPHIAREVQNLLRRHFTEDRIISRAFPTRWPPRSPDLTPCDFWLWGYLKDKVYRGNIRNLAELKNQILLHARNIGSDQLHAAVDHVITRCHMLVLKQGDHIENHL